MTVGLEAFEDFLAVVQDCGRGVQGNGSVGLDPGILPTAIPIGINLVVDDGGVVGEVVAEAWVRQDGCTLLSRLRGFRKLLAEFDAVGSLSHVSSTVSYLAGRTGPPKGCGSAMDQGSR
ncbi:hypothetical protein D3C73_1263110 [compost metagenome]